MEINVREPLTFTVPTPSCSILCWQSKSTQSVWITTQGRKMCRIKTINKIILIKYWVAVVKGVGVQSSKPMLLYRVPLNTLKLEERAAHAVSLCRILLSCMVQLFCTMWGQENILYKPHKECLLSALAGCLNKRIIPEKKKVCIKKEVVTLSVCSPGLQVIFLHQVMSHSSPTDSFSEKALTLRSLCVVVLALSFKPLLAKMDQVFIHSS